MILDDTYCAYINLDSRPDRNEHIIKEITRVGIPVNRHKAFLPEQFEGAKYEIMRRRTPGAIGCYMSQVGIMLKAEQIYQHSLVMEDDLIFCDDFQERLIIIEEFLKTTNWDVFWFGGTYHRTPTWHSSPHPQDLKQCKCNLNRDYETTYHPQIVRTYGAFSTHCYLVNRSSIANVLESLDSVIGESYGIDHAFIRLQPQLKTFAFDPGCVKQMDGQSNIGNGLTIFSGFEKLGSHWFKEIL